MQHCARFMSTRSYSITMCESSSISSNIAAVIQRISRAASLRLGVSVPREDSGVILPRLVCVSKTKPPSAVTVAYEAGQRNFGENYVNELEEKSAALASVCPGLQWHYIGHLQSNKVKKVTDCPNLYMIETIDSAKLADKVERAWASKGCGRQLRVLVQVNTSGEDQKSGIFPKDTRALVEHILNSCPSLQFSGLMTIGSLSHDYSEGPNPDFVELLKCKKDLSESLHLDPSTIELSMGMSNDFEQAIAMGSTSVRVGSLIFGAR